MDVKGEGHLFGSGSDEPDLSAPTGNLELTPGSPPEAWSFNRLGQPLWLLDDYRSQLTASWAVIVPPRSDCPVPHELASARARDRAEQGLPTWGQALSVEEADRLKAIGPASMPVIPWQTDRPVRRGNPSIAWTAREAAGCAAWLADVRGWNIRKIGATLFPSEVSVEAGKPPYDFDSHRQKVRRYVAMGRRVLCDQGVWPWMTGSLDEYGVPTDDDLIEDVGGLPARWWEDEWVLSHLDVWRILSEDLAEHRLAALEGPVSHDGLPPAW